MKRNIRWREKERERGGEGGERHVLDTSEREKETHKEKERERDLDLHRVVNVDTSESTNTYELHTLSLFMPRHSFNHPCETNKYGDVMSLSLLHSLRRGDRDKQTNKRNTPAPRHSNSH